MKLAKLLVAAAIFIAATPFALADTFDGVVNLSGGAAFTPTSLTFIQPFESVADSGVTSSFSNGSVNYLLGTVAYNNPILGAIEAFTITNGDYDVLAFMDTDNDVTSGVDPSTGLWTITLDESGFYTLNGGVAMPGYFDVTMVGDSAYGSTQTTFSGSGALNGDPSLFAGIGPEPASVYLLGSGILGLMALMQLRRRPQHGIL